MISNFSKIVVITGATKGLGLELSRNLIKMKTDWLVVLTGRNEIQGKEISKDLTEKGYSNFVFKNLDVCNLESISSFAEDIKKSYNRCDILINNAAILDHDWTPEGIAKTMITNVRGPIFLTDALLPLLNSTNYAKIINLTSFLGNLSNVPEQVQQELRHIVNNPPSSITELWNNFEQLSKKCFDIYMQKESHGSYKISKNCVNIYTLLLAQSLKSQGFSTIVSAVHPGWVKTDMGGASAPRTIDEGIETALWLCLSDPTTMTTGKLFHDKAPYSYL